MKCRLLSLRIIYSDELYANHVKEGIKCIQNRTIATRLKVLTIKKLQPLLFLNQSE